MYRIIVHEDKNPLVRMQVFKQRIAFTAMLARTHNGLLDRGYALHRTTEEGGQRATTYKWVQTAEALPRIHVTVFDG